MPERRAVGYVRVSSVRGRDGDSFLSPELQRKAIEEGVKRYGYELVGVYEELDVSGRKGVHRPEFERMMADARAGGFEAVVVAKLSRFGRSLLDALRNLDELAALGVALVPLDHDVDMSTPNGKFVRNLLLSHAEMESDRIGAEWKAVHAHRSARGIAHVPGGLYGYTVEGARIVGIDETRAPAVRLAYELRESGDGYRTIANRLNAEGYRAMRGGFISGKAVEKWLKNPHFAGLVEHEAELIKAEHDPIVERDLWERVQARHGKVNGQARFRRGLLSGVLVCSGCGYRLEYRPSTRDGARYTCSARRYARECKGGVGVVAAKVDEYVTAQLLLSRFTTDDDANSRTRVRLAALEQEGEKLRGALDRLAEDRYFSASITADEYARQAQRVHDLQADNEAELRELRDSLARPPDVLDEDGRVVVPWNDMELSERRRVLRELVERIVLHPSASQGGRRDRGIDFARLEFEWKSPVRALITAERLDREAAARDLTFDMAPGVYEAAQERFPRGFAAARDLFPALFAAIDSHNASSRPEAAAKGERKRRERKRVARRQAA
jgi:DNA invertase Pin-like site-specific DNA recombinase